MSARLLEHDGAALLHEARAALQPALAAGGADDFDVTHLAARRAATDDVTKLLLRTRRGRPIAVAYVSSPAAPRMVAQCMRRMAAMRRLLGPRLGQVILTPLAQGDVLGRTFAAVPYCPALRENRAIRAGWRIIVGSLVLRWLHDAVATTRAEPADYALDRCVLQPFAFLAGLNAMPLRRREAARNAIARVESGAWKPVLAMEHGDLWMGNVLLVPSSFRFDLLLRLPRPFALVDWYGSRMRSPGMYDLLRLSKSIRLSRAALGRHVRRHCSRERLNCDEVDAYSCLAASLGHIAMHLGHFPMARFIRMADSCFQALDEALQPA